jgi:DeoR/GlpR family transcriptional regulator of sugar metabolism
MVRLAHITEVDALFTDRAPPAAIRAALERAGGRVFIAEAETAGAA